MKYFRTILILLMVTTSAFKTGKPAWLLYSQQGKKVRYEKMIRDIRNADVILFGEYHNNPVSHWLQLELSRDLLAVKGQKLVLGAEMFETDNQIILNEYVQGIISQSRFEAEARLWPNYTTDYRPLVEMARENQLRFVATNIPRRYASLVHSGGFEGLEKLSGKANDFLPPLPIEYNPDLPAYKSMLEMEGPGHHVNKNFPKAQAIKDATMAHFILKNWSPGNLFLHFNGTYHSDNFEGIYWYLMQQNPDLKIATITTVSQSDISSLEDENLGKANYIICVDEDMTPTH
ncbi:MAG: ChaN family lipoprotein [Bacteroidota bacterium]